MANLGRACRGLWVLNTLMNVPSSMGNQCDTMMSVFMALLVMHGGSSAKTNWYNVLMKVLEMISNIPL